MTRKTVFLLFAILVVATVWRLSLTKTKKGHMPPPFPPVEVQTLSSKDILRWEAEENGSVVVITKRDALPGGLSAAMTPAFVDWDQSDLESKDPTILLRNVNDGGNPIEGTTVLQSMRVHLNSLSEVDFILVPLGRGGRRAAAHHAQLRFVFDDGQPIEILDQDLLGRRTLKDLVLSWEAWRPPGADYSMMKGMLPSAYALSLRAFAGPQRFLEDSLAGREWYGYRMRLPGGHEGLRELLRVSLVLGDGVARHEAGKILEEGEEEWAAHAPLGARSAQNARERWEELRRGLSVVKVSDDPLLNLPPQDRTYQTLLRSCASMAYYAIVTSAARLAARGLTDGLNPDDMPNPEMPQVEPWMKEIADADLGGVFLRAPTALAYLVRHPEVIPSKIPAKLDHMGLIQRRSGTMLTVTWNLKTRTPYPNTALVR